MMHFEDVARAGWELGPLTGEAMFRKILETPGGVKIGVVSPDQPFAALKTKDKKIHVHVPELESWLKEVTPAAEEQALASAEWPFLLMAGNHMEAVANTIMRDPSWNEGRRCCTMRIHPDDAARLGLGDGDQAVVETAAGSAAVEAEVTATSHPGQVVVPHGFGLVHGGQSHGVNVNRLAPAKHRDRFAATPLHRHIPCRIRKG
jgi:anaerobic selenocysteine-containing dehydrogenase